MPDIAMKRVHVYLPLATFKKARTKAKQLGIPVSEYIRRAVQAFLEQ